MELVLVLFGFILLWRQRKIRKEFGELDKRHAAQNDALRRELLELRRRIDGGAVEPAAATAPSVASAPPEAPAPEVRYRATVQLVAEMPPGAPPVAIPPAPVVPEPKVPLAPERPAVAPTKPMMPATPSRPIEPPPPRPSWLDQPPISPPATSARVVTPPVVAPLRVSAPQPTPPKATSQQRMKKVFAAARQKKRRTYLRHFTWEPPFGVWSTL